VEDSGELHVHRLPRRRPAPFAPRTWRSQGDCLRATDFSPSGLLPCVESVRSRLNIVSKCVACAENRLTQTFCFKSARIGDGKQVPEAFDCGEDRRSQSEGRAHRLGCGSKLRFSEQSKGIRHTTGGGLCGEQVPEAFDCGEDRRFQPEDRAHRLGCGSKLRFSEQSIGVRHTTGGGLCGEQVPEAFDCGEDRRFQSEDRAHRLGCGSKLRFSEQSIGVRHTTGGGLCGE